MNAILEIIDTLSPIEKKKFIYRLKLKNKRKDTKNIELFKLLDRVIPPENPVEALYGKNAKGAGAYHALCKRLYDNLIDFIAAKNIEEESSKEMKALKLILSSRSFFRQQKIKLGFKTLAKAKMIAVKYDLYSTLHEIYQLELAYAHLNDAINFLEVRKQFTHNKHKLVQEENLNLFCATIQDELSHKKPNSVDVIERNLKLHDISITENLSYQSLFKILQISNEVAHVTRKYYDILDFIDLARRNIQVSERTQNEHLYFHIQILYYLANTYFRIKSFKKAALNLKKMHEHMLLQDKKYYRVFSCQYELLKNLLLIYTGQLTKAIVNLENFDFSKHKLTETYVHDLQLTLTMCFFLAEDYQKALKMYRGFFHSDQWYSKKVGFIWVVKKNLLEILLLIELDYIDLTESRLKSFRKKHSAHLSAHGEQRILTFVQLVSNYYLNKELIHKESFLKKLDGVLENNLNEEDIFAISFYAWLKSKTMSEKTYETCLEYMSVS